MGAYHAEVNRLQAVQYGFTLVRCSHMGISGVYDQFYRVHAQKFTGAPGSQF